MNRLSTEKRAQIVSALVEGVSIRATARMVGCSKNTVTKLLVELGQACAEYQDAALRELPCKRLQVDEIWSFVYAKQRNVPASKRGSLVSGTCGPSLPSAPIPSSSRRGLSVAVTVESLPSS